MKSSTVIKGVAAKVLLLVILLIATWRAPVDIYKVTVDGRDKTIVDQKRIIDELRASE